MSFWTSVQYVRPTPPPLVTAGNLLQLAAEIESTGLLDKPGLASVRLKYGRSVDRDRKPTIQEVPLGGNMFAIRDIEWDVDLSQHEVIAERTEALRADERPLYRASIGWHFGALSESVRQHLQTDQDEEGRKNLALGDVYLHASPIVCGGLSTDGSVQVGWISLSLGGQGYLYPWKPADVAVRLNTHPVVRRAAAACEGAFPINTAKLSRNGLGKLRRHYVVRRARRILGDFWPFGDEQPDRWAWCVSESG